MQTTSTLVRHCDILIIGAGPAGLAALQSVLQRQLAVIIVDDNPRAGGQIWRQSVTGSTSAIAKPYLTALQHTQVTYLPSHKVVAVDSHQVLIEGSNQSIWIHYQKLILCLGAKEKILPFAGWTLSGVTGVGGLQALTKNGLPLQNEKVVIAGSGPLLLATADTVKKAGGKVVAIVEQATQRSLLAFGWHLLFLPSKLMQAVALLPLKHYYTNSMVLEAQGEDKITSVLIESHGRKKQIDCTRLACGFGLRPNIELAQWLGCSIEQGAIVVDDRQTTTVENVYAAGECTSVGGSELAIIEGHIAGWVASEQVDKIAPYQLRRQKWHHFSQLIAKTFQLNERVTQLCRPETIICRCEDVPLHAIQKFDNWQQAKITTRCGMGACQGKICANILHDILGWSTPFPRIPHSPIRVETLAGLAQEYTPKKLK